MTLRELKEADRDLLAGFTCALPDEPWSQVVQNVIRYELVEQIASQGVVAIGLFGHDGGLCGVAAWRISGTKPPILCRSDIVAVAVRERRKGYGRMLKEARIAGAKAGGAAAVASIVHRRNTAMISLNEALGAQVEEMPDDPDHCRCFIGPL